MEERIREWLGETHFIGRRLHCFPVLDSTNTYLKALAMDGGENGTVIIAEHQTAGRGRMERRFQSPDGKGLYLSVLLRPEVPSERLPCVTALAGVAVCDAVEDLCGEGPGLKWPNDPVLHGKKLAGILTELVVDEDGQLAVVLGIGINVHQGMEDFSSDVAEFATSLELEGFTAVSRAELAAVLLRRLEEMYFALLEDDLHPWLAAYRQDCVNLGKVVQLIQPDGSRETAVARDIDADFGLVVETVDGVAQTVRTGEVSVRGLYGYVE